MSNKGDSISRQAVIAKFKPWLKVKGHTEGELNILRAVLFELTVMPTAQPETHWIPCSEELPAVGMGIIFCDVDGDIFVGHRACEHWWSVDDKVKNVVAWMPLPEPYKEEGDQ